MVRDSLHKGTLAQADLPPHLQTLTPTQLILDDPDCEMEVLSPTELDELCPVIDVWRASSLSVHDMQTYLGSAPQNALRVVDVDGEHVCFEPTDNTFRAQHLI